MTSWPSSYCKIVGITANSKENLKAVQILAVKLTSFSKFSIFLDAEQISTVKIGLKLVALILTELQQEVSIETLTVGQDEVVLISAIQSDLVNLELLLKSLLSSNSTTSPLLTEEDTAELIDTIANVVAIIKDSGKTFSLIHALYKI